MPELPTSATKTALKSTGHKITKYALDIVGKYQGGKMPKQWESPICDGMESLKEKVYHFTTISHYLNGLLSHRAFD